MPTTDSTNKTMNLIDIASWQKGIDLAAVFGQNNLDGVIIKATQGLTYVNTEYAAWVKWLTANNKPFGVYHYCNGQDAAGEAAHFYEVVKQYIGRCVPAADYEGDALHSGTGWLKKFLDKFYDLSGVKCLVYCSQSVTQEQDFNAIASAGYKLWVAQYADMNPVNGFLEHPWQKGSVKPFDGYVMQQYTSCGRLKGWGGNLDFDLFNGTVDDWTKLCESGETPAPSPAPAPSPTLKPADPSIVLRTLKNEFGTGTDRIIRLRELGYDPTSVQKKINQLYVIGGKVKQDIGNEMSYLNSILWIVRS